MDGAGVYNDLCTQTRESCEADAVVLIIINGKLGSGISVQSKLNPALKILPTVLRGMADEMEADIDESTRKPA